VSVKKEVSGRRSVQVEIEVPGTPEEVWQAIATGPGISSWFVPTEFKERDGKHGCAELVPLRGSGHRNRRPRNAAVAGVDSRTLPDAVGDEPARLDLYAVGDELAHVSR
jgi:hypothetical protein